jgi:imidazolonepropionase-like amidohydrolase
MRILIALLCFFAMLPSCAQDNQYDVVIQHAAVFDSKTGTVWPNQTILIRSGKIEAVTGRRRLYSARKYIDAEGKLVTPGFVDTHIHPADVFGDYEAAPLYLPADSLDYYRKKLSDQYLPYGVTMAMMMGHPENWLDPILNWSTNPSPYYTDFYTTGGALISKESRKPYVGHTTLESPEEARQKVMDYFRKGIRHIKLYWRLRRPEFEAALKTADSLGMKAYGHIDQNIMFMDTTLEKGLKNYEHILTLDNSVLHFQQDGPAFGASMQQYYPGIPVGFTTVRLEMFRFIHDHKQAAMDSLINLLASHQVSFSTTIHLMAEQFGLTYFTNNKDSVLSDAQLARCRENFKIFMGYARQMSDKGISLRIGTDCPNGGKAFLSEQLLMFEYGFSIPEILRISTINGARALGMDDQYGILEKGRKADLLIWEKNPFDDYRNFQSPKIVMKDGVVVSGWKK